MTNPLHDAAMAAKRWADAVLDHLNDLDNQARFIARFRAQDELIEALWDAGVLEE